MTSFNSKHDLLIYSFSGPITQLNYICKGFLYFSLILCVQRLTLLRWVGGFREKHQNDVQVGNMNMDAPPLRNTCYAIISLYNLSGDWHLIVLMFYWKELLFHPLYEFALEANVLGTTSLFQCKQNNVHLFSQPSIEQQ